MTVVSLACLCLIAITTLIHYETLSLLNSRLPALPIANRLKLLVTIGVMFAAHTLEIAVYAAAFYWLIEHGQFGTLEGASHVGFFQCFVLSAETYTSVGFGDLTPAGPIRLMTGVEALNGLLLIAWSASFTYLAMERYWARN